MTGNKYSLIQFAGPPPAGHPLPEPSDAVRTFVFMANLAAQEASGDPAASTSPERVLHRLRGSSESTAYIFGVVDAAQDPLPPAELSELGFPLVPSTGDCPEYNFVGFLHLNLPLLEETANAELEGVLDVDFLPLPGQCLEPDAAALAEWMIQKGTQVARELGRSTVQSGTLSPAQSQQDTDAFRPALEAAGFQVKHIEDQFLIPIAHPAPSALLPHGIAVEVWEDYDIAKSYLDAVLDLLTIASSDSLTGDLSVEPIQWTRQRLAEAHARLRSRRSHTLLVALVDVSAPGRILSMTELGRHEAADPHVAEWTITVTARERRREGLATLAKISALQAITERWPEVTKTFCSVGHADKAMQSICTGLGAVPISTSAAWELHS